MTFYATYLIEYSRVLAGIILEGRQSLAQTKDKTGFEVKAFFDSEINKVTTNVVPYKIETEQGNLAAYFSVLTDGIAGQQYQLFIRPSFAAYALQLSLFISNFIGNGSWKADILQGELA